MHRNLGERLTIDDMARSAMFSKFHFSRVFQRVTGVSPGRFLSAMRLEEAKRLLLVTSFTVADISHRVGYNSVGTFSSRFRSSVGVSPTTYRQLGGNTSTIPTEDLLAPSRTEQRPAGRAAASLRGRVIAPSGQDLAMVFVGLFPSRILQGPAVRAAVLSRPGTYVLPTVPQGTWYLMAHAIAARGVETTPFVGSYGPVVIEPEVTARIADVHLRPMRALDPPVLMAMPDAAPETAGTGITALAS
jgi:AraC-like DNA-binding protein